MKRFVLFILFVFPLCGLLQAQTPTDAVMMKPREACFALMYDNGSWDHYWEGDYLRTNGNVGTLKRRMIMPMIAIGVHEKLNVIIGVPHIKTESDEPNGGKMNGVSGFQDIFINVKAEVFKKDLGVGKFSVLTNAGFSTPLSNYLSDYQPYALGLGATEWSLRGIAQYKIDKSVYVQVAMAHLWRGQTEIERDYYYNNGSYYTNRMDVPNAWHFNGAIGIFLLDNSLKLEVNYMSLNSTSGDDIRKYNAGQPTNKVEVGQAGFATQYFVSQLKGLSVMGYYSKIISGRNMGEFSNFGLGLAYQFKM